MKRILFLIFLFLFLLKPLNVFSSDYEKYLPKWIKLLETGDEKEKKLALENLWFLKYPEYRRDSSVFNPIFDALKDKDPSIREATAAYLKRLGELSKGCCKETNIIPSLIEALEDDSPRVRAEAAKALGYYRDERAVAPLIKSLKDKDPWVRLNAAFSLGELRAFGPRRAKVIFENGKPHNQVSFKKKRVPGIEKSIYPLLELLNDNSDWRNKYVQQEGIIALRMLGAKNKNVISFLIQKSSDDYLKAEIIRTLGAFRAVEAKDLFMKAMQDSDEMIRKLASEAMLRLPITGQFAGDEKLELFITLLKDPSAEIRAKAAYALGKLKDPKAVDPLVEALHDEDVKVKRTAVIALGKFDDPRIFDPLLELAGERLGYKNPLKDTFLSIAKKTSEIKVVTYRKDGIKYISKDRRGIPKGVKIIKRMVHPLAVDKLINTLNKPDSKVKLSVLNIIWNFEDERIEPILIKFLDDPSPNVKKQAITSLSNYASNKAVPKLINALKDKDDGVRAAAAKALERFQDKRALIPLIGSLDDSNGAVREAAARTLGKLHDKRALTPLIEKRNDSNYRVRQAVLSSLRSFDDPSLLGLYIDMLKDESPYVRRTAVGNVRKTPDKRAVEPLILLLNDPDSDVPSIAAEALGKIGDKRAVEPLIKALNGEFNRNRRFRGDERIQRKAAGALGMIGDKTAVLALIKTLDDKDLGINFKTAIIKALGLTKNKQAAPALIKLLSDERSRIRQQALLAIGEIGDPSALDAMKALLDDEKFTSKRIVIESMGKIKNDRAVGMLIDSLNSSDRYISIEAIKALGVQKNKRAIKQLLKKVGKDKGYQYHSFVKNALNDYEYPAMIDTLIGYLEDGDFEIKKGAIILLGEFKDQRAIEPLKAFLEDNDIIIRDYAKYSIQKLKASKSRRVDDKVSQKRQGSLSMSRATRIISKDAIEKDIEEKQKSQTKLYSVESAIKVPKPQKKMYAKTEKIQEISINVVIPPPLEKPDTEQLVSNLKDNNPKIRREAVDRLGDIGDKEAVEHLIPLLKDNDEYVRQAAARSLGMLKDKKAVEPLIDTLKDRDEYVRAYSAWALGEIKDTKAIEHLIHSLQEEKQLKAKERKIVALKMFKEDPAARNMIATIFMRGLANKNYLQTANMLPVFSEDIMLRGFENAKGDDAKTIGNYVKLLESNYYGVSKFGIKGLKEFQDRKLVIKELSDLIKTEEKEHDKAISFLSRLKYPECLPVFVYILENRERFSSSAKRYAIGAIGDLACKEVFNFLLKILIDTNEYEGTREAAARAIGKLGDRKAAAPLIDIIKNKSEHKNVRVGAAVALKDIGGVEAVDPLISILKDNNEDIWLRVAAASVLGNIGDEMAIKPLEETANDPSDYLRNAVKTALRKFKN